MLKFIDVYHGNPAPAVTKALAAVDGVIVKASEAGSIDPAHAATVKAARAAKKLVGHYHYAWLGLPAAPQASLFVRAAGARPGEVLVVDVEQSRGAGPKQWPTVSAARVAWILVFAAAVKKATGAPCWIYCNTSTWKVLLAASTPTQRKALLALPLWIAAPSYTAGKPPVAPWTMHQYGVAGGLDRDVFNGTAARFKALGVPVKATAPKPATKPPVAPAPAPVPPAPPVAATPPVEAGTGLDVPLDPMLPSIPRSLIRTIVPAAVGQIVSWAALVHVSVDPAQQAELATGLGVALTAGYYAGVRALEQRWPRIGWLLGAKGAPAYPTP